MANIKIIVYKALIRSIINYTCPGGCGGHSDESAALAEQFSALLANLTGTYRSRFALGVQNSVRVQLYINKLCEVLNVRVIGQGETRHRLKLVGGQVYKRSNV
jgi:hypothetical protein